MTANQTQEAVMQVLSLVSLKRSDHKSRYFDPPFEHTPEGLVKYRKSVINGYPRIPFEECVEIATMMLEAFDWNWMAIARAIKQTSVVKERKYFSWKEVEKRVRRFTCKPYSTF